MHIPPPNRKQMGRKINLGSLRSDNDFMLRHIEMYILKTANTTLKLH